MYLVNPLLEIQFVSKASVCLGGPGGKDGKGHTHIYMYIHICTDIYIPSAQMNIFLHISVEGSPNIFLG